MGAWGTRTFENDQAMDWLDSFRGEPTEQTLIAALLDPCESEYSNPEGVVAAAEVVASLIGKPAPVPHEELADLPPVEFDREALPRLAVVAIDRVCESWLNDSWAETDTYDQWVEEVSALRSRLAPN